MDARINSIGEVGNFLLSSENSRHFSKSFIESKIDYEMNKIYLHHLFGELVVIDNSLKGLEKKPKEEPWLSKEGFEGRKKMIEDEIKNRMSKLKENKEYFSL